MFILGLGVRRAFTPSISAATSDIHTADAGVASAIVNTSQQVGGAVGTAVLSTVFSAALTRYLASHQPGSAVQSAAAVHGYAIAFSISALIFLGGALVAAGLLRSRPVTPAAPNVDEDEHDIRTTPPRRRSPVAARPRGAARGERRAAGPRRWRRGSGRGGN